MKEIETWISPTGKYLVIVLSSESNDQEAVATHKIVTNDKLKTHVDKPKFYGSFVEAIKRVEVLEAGPRIGENYSQSSKFPMTEAITFEEVTTSEERKARHTEHDRLDES